MEEVYPVVVFIYLNNWFIEQPIAAKVAKENVKGKNLGKKSK